MRATVIIVCGTVLLVLGLLLARHFKRSAPAASPESSEQFSVANSPRPRLTAPRLPAPRLPVTAAPAEAEPESATTTNLFARLMNSDLPRVSAEQLAAYLQKHRRSAESLMGAFAATGDRAYLREALEKNPHDPRLNLAAYGDARAAEVSAEGYDRNQPVSAERRQLLNTFAKAAPDNSLANYLLALDCFKAGQTDQAVEQLVAASQKPKFQDYSLDYIQDAEEAYRAAGCPEAEAKALATTLCPLPPLTELRDTGAKLVELAALYRQAGDEASAQAAEQIGLGLGQRLTEPGQLTIIQELVGMSIERKVLGSMDPNSVLAGTGETVQSRLDALKQRQAALKGIAGPAWDILPTLSERDAANYFDRLKVFGEAAAGEWLLKTFGNLSVVETSQLH